MEINAFEDVIGVVPVVDVVEGRFVVLSTHDYRPDFGSQEDLPGVHIPATTEQARRARFVLTFAVDNRPLPLINSYPQMDFALRGGFDQDANAPFSNTMHLSYPGNQDGRTIASGQSALAFSHGTFTIPSGGYIYNASMINPGASLIIANTADDGGDAGKLKYTASEAVGVLFETYSFDSETARITVRSK